MSCIALFDSGVGGLSILPAIKQNIPNTDIIYLADHHAAPYGNKDPKWLNTRILELVSQLDKRHNLDAIIIACNTASTICLEGLRTTINTPIIGVVPAVKTAAHLSVNQSIGILATPSTINGTYLQSLINDFASQCNVTKVGSTELVTMAEKKLSQQPINYDTLHTIISPFIEARCDVVVLGCTHFPHLIEELTKLAPHIRWIDSADAIAKRCVNVLTDSHALVANQNVTSKLTGKSIFYSTAPINVNLKESIESIGFKQTQTFATTIVP